MEKWIFAGLFISLIVLDAVGDGLRDRRFKTVAGIFETLLLTLLLGSMLFFQTLYWPVTLWPDQCALLILAYAVLRYALFDVIYNLVKGNFYLFTIGNIKLFDRVHNKIINWLVNKSWIGEIILPPKDIFVFVLKGLALVLGFLLIKWSF